MSFMDGPFDLVFSFIYKTVKLLLFSRAPSSITSFGKKRFILNEITRQNTSIIAIFLEYEKHHRRSLLWLYYEQEEKIWSEFYGKPSKIPCFHIPIQTLPHKVFLKDFSYSKSNHRQSRKTTTFYLCTKYSLQTCSYFTLNLGFPFLLHL